MSLHDDLLGQPQQHLTSTGVADPLANLHHVTEQEVAAAQDVVDATVGIVGEDEEALRAGEEAAAAAMEGEIFVGL